MPLAELNETVEARGAAFPLRGRYDVRIGIDRFEQRRGIHAGKKPRGAMTGSRAEFKKPPTRVRRGERREQGTHPGLGRHAEPKRFGVP